MFASKDLFFTNKSGGYQISRSVRLRSNATAYLNRTPASAGNRTTWTWSGWIKRGTLGVVTYFFSANTNAGSDTDHTDIRFASSDTLQFANDTGGSVTVNLITTQVFRDPSAWYHIVIALDTTQATASNRVKFYVNGVQITAFGTATYPAQNANLFINNNINHRLGSYQPTSNYFDGYLTEINFIGGQALTPSSFGQTNPVTGVWQPIKYTGTYGTNGFYLNFSDNSSNTATTIGKDYSGNGNNWTPNNISVTAGVTYDSMLDVPTLYADGGNGRGNYCTGNPLSSDTSGPMTNGNLDWRVDNTRTSVGSIAMSSGKWYFEIIPTAILTTIRVGIASTGRSYAANNVNPSGFADGYSYISIGSKENNGSVVAYGASYTVNDVIGVAFDADAGTLTFYKNNASQGTAYSGISGAFVAFAYGTGVGVTSCAVNFGQRPFTYTPPTGFKALNTQNLPTPTISNGANYMAATTYTGNGTSQSISNAVNGVSFQPDFVWIKSRSTADSNWLVNSIVGSGIGLISNSTAAEQTIALVTSLNSNGYTVNNPSNGTTNGSAYSLVGWSWKAGGTSSSNTNGSITSTVSVGATQGFSVVTYTGTGANATVGHGLGVAPSMIITKTRSSAAGNWGVYHASVGATKGLNLNNTIAATTAIQFWNNTSPTSSVFSIGTSNDVNASATTYVAYCFAEVAGFSKFGSYTGNGSADGPFVYCGFRPRFIIIKSSDLAQNWTTYDTSRIAYNSQSAFLFPMNSNAEDTVSVYNIDILSNGFKIRTTNINQNGSTNTYIFMVFAENPYKLSLAR